MLYQDKASNTYKSRCTFELPLAPVQVGQTCCVDTSSFELAEIQNVATRIFIVVPAILILVLLVDDWIVQYLRGGRALGQVHDDSEASL